MSELAALSRFPFSRYPVLPERHGGRPRSKRGGTLQRRPGFRAQATEGMPRSGKGRAASPPGSAVQPPLLFFRGIRRPLHGQPERRRISGGGRPSSCRIGQLGKRGLRRIQGEAFLMSREDVSTPTAWSRKPKTGRRRVRPGSLPRLFPGGFCSPGPSCPQWDRHRHPRAPERFGQAPAHGPGR